MADAEKICFVIAPIGKAGSETRNRSDQILRHIIRPAVEEFGYTAIRADEISDPGLITRQVIQLVVDAPLVVADLTERNPNVFYELALRHTLRKPLIQVIDEGDEIPFDVAGMRTVLVNHRDLDKAARTREEIKKQIQALEQGAAGHDTPISTALELGQLQLSDDPKARTLGDLLVQLEAIRKDVSVIEGRISDPEQLLPSSYILNNAPGAEAQRLMYLAIDDLLGRIANSTAWWKQESSYSELQRDIDRIRHLLSFAHDAGK